MKGDAMILKSTLLAGLGALAIAGPAAAQAQATDAPPSNAPPSNAPPSYSSGHHHHYVRHHYVRRDYDRRDYHHGCGFYRRYEYGLFGHYQKRWTWGCR
jgi:hypothetical protein